MYPPVTIIGKISRRYHTMKMEMVPKFLIPGVKNRSKTNLSPFFVSGRVLSKLFQGCWYCFKKDVQHDSFVAKYDQVEIMRQGKSGTLHKHAVCILDWFPFVLPQYMLETKALNKKKDQDKTEKHLTHCYVSYIAINKSMYSQ